MPSLAELPPITEDRRLAVAQWVETNVRPVLHAAAEASGATLDFEMRPYQIDAWDRLSAAREIGRTRALGDVAMGLGKTFIAAVDVMRFREECERQDPPMYPRILYVSHKHDINVQAAKTLRLLMPDADIDFFKTGRKRWREVDIELATIQALYSELDRFDPKDYEYIIWDESHHTEAETYSTVRDYFRPLFEHAITGTRERMDGKDIQAYFGLPLYQKTLAEGMAEGWLADVEYHVILDKTIKKRLEGSAENLSLPEIIALFSHKASLESIFHSIEEEIQRLGLVDPKTLVFCDNIGEAETMARLLRGRAYHSSVKDPTILEDYRANRQRRLTVRDMLNEGVDVPDIELEVFLRYTESAAVFEQQIGRGLRKAPGKTRLYVLDYVANIERFARVWQLSQAVKKRAEELGHTTEESVGSQIRIHTPHGDFDFENIAIPFIQKYLAAKEGRRRFTREGVIALALAASPEAPLGYRQIETLAEKGDFPNYQGIKWLFGSRPAFCRACGFDVPDRIPTESLDADGLVDLALQVSPDVPLTTPQINRLSKQRKFVSPNFVLKHFDSIADFQRACGFDVPERIDTAKMSNQELVDLAKRLSPDAALTAPRIAALSREGLFASIPAILSRFDSIPDFQKACGFAHDKAALLKMSPEQLVDAALKLQPNRPLLTPEIKELSKAGEFLTSNALRHPKRFGSFPAFQEACRKEIARRALEAKTDGGEAP